MPLSPPRPDLASILSNQIWGDGGYNLNLEDAQQMRIGSYLYPWSVGSPSKSLAV